MRRARFDEAEPLLLAGYETDDRTTREAAAKRLGDFYARTGRPDLAARYPDP